jgi:hypothetical protein
MENLGNNREPAVAAFEADEHGIDDGVKVSAQQQQSTNKKQKKTSKQQAKNVHIVSPSKNIPSFLPVSSQTIQNRSVFSSSSLKDTNKQYQQQNKLIDDIVNHMFSQFCYDLLINPASFIYSLLSLTLNIPVLTLITFIKHHHHNSHQQDSSQSSIPAIAAFSSSSTSSSSVDSQLKGISEFLMLKHGDVYMGNTYEIRLNLMNSLKLLDAVCINRDLKYKICLIYSQIEEANDNETWNGNHCVLSSPFPLLSYLFFLSFFLFPRLSSFFLPSSLQCVNPLEFLKKSIKDYILQNSKSMNVGSLTEMKMLTKEVILENNTINYHTEKLVILPIPVAQIKKPKH